MPGTIEHGSPFARRGFTRADERQCSAATIIQLESKPSNFGLVDMIGHVDAAKITCKTTTIRQNDATSGGGISAVLHDGTNLEGEVTLTSCQILRNTASQNISVTPAVDSALRPSFGGVLISAPVEGIQLINHTRNRDLSFTLKGTESAPSRVSRHNGLAIYASNWANRYSRLGVTLKHVSFQSNGYSVVSCYSSLDIKKCQFGPSRSISRPIDVAVLDAEAAGRRAGRNNQSVSITDCHFASHDTEIGVAVAKATGGNLTPINVQIQKCRFLGRTVGMAPPAAVEPNGAVIVITIASKDVDAQKNYWGNGLGPNAPGNPNLMGSYASRLVNYSDWLRK